MYKYEQQIKEYWEKGYTELPNFFTESEIDSLSIEISKIIDSLDFNEHRRVFRTGKQQQGDDYFVNSGQNISFFFEEGAFDADGNLAVPKGQCLNKMGHALHELNPVFKSLTFDDRVKTLLKGLGHVKPHVVQGMINFKNPRIGTEYTPHRDAEFLYTEPEIKLTGFWVPLADVTVENGCLYFIPGSHRESVTRRFVRNKDDSGPRVSFNAPMDKYDESRFVPVTAKKGSLLLIHGLVVHKSTANTSDKGRPAYTFHVVDLDGTKWASDNWLQPTEKLPFSRVYG